MSRFKVQFKWCCDDQWSLGDELNPLVQARQVATTAMVASAMRGATHSVQILDTYVLVLFFGTESDQTLRWFQSFWSQVPRSPAARCGGWCGEIMNIISIFFLAVTWQLYRFPCHSLTDSLIDTFEKHYQRALWETCDPWDMLSEWWGDMTWQTKRQWQ